MRAIPAAPRRKLAQIPDATLSGIIHLPLNDGSASVLSPVLSGLTHWSESDDTSFVFAAGTRRMFVDKSAFTLDAGVNGTELDFNTGSGTIFTDPLNGKNGLQYRAEGRMYKHALGNTTATIAPATSTEIYDAPADNATIQWLVKMPMSPPAFSTYLSIPGGSGQMHISNNFSATNLRFGRVTLETTLFALDGADHLLSLVCTAGTWRVYKDDDFTTVLATVVNAIPAADPDSLLMRSHGAATDAIHRAMFTYNRALSAAELLENANYLRDASRFGPSAFGSVGSTSLVDFYGFSNLTSSSGTVIEAPIFRHDGSALGGGRPTGQNISGAATADQRTDLAGDWTAEFLLELDSLSTDLQTVIALRGTGATSASNARFWLQTRTDGRLRMNWQSGTLTDHESHSDAGAVRVGVLHHVAVRKYTTSGGDIVVTFFVDGACVGAEIETANPTGGTSANWCFMSSDGAGALALVGDVYEARIVGRAMSDGFIRESGARALRAHDMDTVYRDQNYTAFARVLVEDTNFAATSGDDKARLVDIDNLAASAEWNSRWRFLQSVEISTDIDSPGPSASIRCKREIYDWSIAPGMLLSPTTGGSNLTAPPLRLSSRVQIEVAVVPFGTTIDEVGGFEWFVMFDGFISSVDWSGPELSLECRDMIAPLQWTFCRPLVANAYQEKVYGDDTVGTAIETVIQSIINDHVPATGIRGGTPTLYTPTSPAWALRRRSIGHEPLYDVIKNKADQIGYALRYKWDDTLKESRLTFYEPDRLSPTTVRTFAVDEYLELRNATTNEENIRNVCEVVFTNRLGTVSTLDDIPRDRVVSSNATSITQYGERYCQIAEEMASQIDTTTEATKLADAVVGDLAEPKNSFEMETGFLHFVELEDFYNLVADGLHFDNEDGLDLAAMSIRWRVDGLGAGRTIVGLRGNPASKSDGHLDDIALPGLAPHAPFLPSDAPATVTIAPGERGATVHWPFPVGRVADAADMFEVHMTSATGAWTPSTSTLKTVTRTNKAVITGLDPSLVYQTKLVVIDKRRNRSTAVAAADFTPQPAQYELGTWLRGRMWAVQARGSEVAIDTFGVTAVETGSPIGAASSGGLLVSYETAAVANSDSGVSITDSIQPNNWLPMFASRIRAPTNISNVRTRIGLFEAGTTVMASDTPTVAGIGFAFDSGNAKWTAYYGDGGVITRTAIGANVIAARVYNLAAGYIDDNTKLVFFIDDVLVLTVNNPAITSGLSPLVMTRTTAAAVKDIGFMRFALTMR